MRYTTVIDISEMPSVYKSHNATRLYLHMSLKAGYHDNDRDLLTASIRTLAADTGLTVSATRHALAVLTKARLIAKVGDIWAIRKWVSEQPIMTRPKTAKQQAADAEKARQKAEREAREREAAAQAASRQTLEMQGKTQFMVYYESLEKRAQAGDVDALRLMERHRAQYEEHSKIAKSKIDKNGEK